MALPRDDTPVSGTIYGQSPSKEDNKVPDTKEMMEEAGIPDSHDGKLPYSLEWYAGAKDRQKARDVESDELLVRKNFLRHDWAEMVASELAEVAAGVVKIQAEPEPLDLAILLARTFHERPADKAEADRVLKLDEDVQIDRDRLKVELEMVRSRLLDNEAKIHAKEEEDMAEEEERKAQVLKERRRKAKNARALARNTARLAGEEVMDTEEEEAMILAAEEAGATIGEDGMPIPGSAENAEEEPDSSKAVSRKGSKAAVAAPGANDAPASIVFEPGMRPPGERGGLARELPPLQSPPPLPPLPSGMPEATDFNSLRSGAP